MPLAIASQQAVAAAQWYLYVLFIAFVLAMLAIDLKLFHTEAHEPSTKESAAWVGVWVSLALGFGVIVYFWKGLENAIEYFSGYLVEYSLSVDNIFVFILIFGYFSIPRRYQHRVLFFGILGAMVFRGIFIGVGTALITRFSWILLVFGVFLIITAIRMSARAIEEVHPERNPILQFFMRHLRTTSSFDGQRLFTIQNAKRVATPLFVVLLFIEFTDIVFAVDSIPAIFGITKDPFIVLTSNLFAVLGLRALYFLLAHGLTRLHLLNYGLAIILGFVGVKMVVEVGGELFWDTHLALPAWASLAFIVVVLSLTAVASLKFPPALPEVVEHPPSRAEAVAGENPGAGDGSQGGSEGGSQGAGPAGPSQGGPSQGAGPGE